MREEIRALAVHDEHQQQLGVQAGGGNVLGREARYGFSEGVFQLHLAISPQRTLRHTEEQRYLRVHEWQNLKTRRAQRIRGGRGEIREGRFSEFGSTRFLAAA